MYVYLNAYEFVFYIEEAGRRLTARDSEGLLVFFFNGKMRKSTVLYMCCIGRCGCGGRVRVCIRLRFLYNKMLYSY